MTHKLNCLIIGRSCLFWLLAVLSLPLYNFLILFIWPLSRTWRHKLIMSVVYYYLFLLRYVAGIRYKVIGKEHIPTTPLIIVANHQSAWETICFNCIFPPLVWIMKKEVLKIPLFGWGARLASPIAIDRKRGESALQQVFEQGKDRFNQGFWICIFPEGTRVPPLQRKPYKHGAAKLALRLGVPLLPVAHNAGFCLPKNSFWLYPGEVRLVIGPPIHPDNKDPLAYTTKIETWINQQLTQMGS